MMKKKCVVFMVLLVFLSLGAFAKWKKISHFPVRDVYLEYKSGIFATKADTGDIYRYNEKSTKWDKVGGPGYTFAVRHLGLFGLSPDKGSVWESKGYKGLDLPLPWEDKWKQIGGPAAMIYACGHFLYATNPVCGDIYRYDQNSKQWAKIGGPGEMFVTGSRSLYGLSPDKKSVWHYIEADNKWENFGSPDNQLVGCIYAGGQVWILATKFSNGDIYSYNRVAKKWEMIGGPGYTFAVTATDIYGLSPDKSGIYKYSKTTAGKWDKIGGPARMIYAGHTRLCYIDKCGELYLYEE